MVGLDTAHQATRSRPDLQVPAAEAQSATTRSALAAVGKSHQQRQRHRQHRTGRTVSLRTRPIPACTQLCRSRRRGRSNAHQRYNEYLHADIVHWRLLWVRKQGNWHFNDAVPLVFYAPLVTSVMNFHFSIPFVAT